MTSLIKIKRLRSRHLPRLVRIPSVILTRLYYQYLVLDPTARRFGRVWPSIRRIRGKIISPDQDYWLYRAAQSLPDNSVIVEIGSFKGRSTACLAYGCLGRNKRVYAIDTFQGNDHDFAFRDFYNEFWRNIKSRRLDKHVEPVVGTSREIAKGWSLNSDLLFVDGSHKYEDVLDDFHGFYTHVKSGGLVAFHDVDEGWPGPWAAWNNVIKHHLVRTGSCHTLAYGYKPEHIEKVPMRFGQEEKQI